MSSLGKYWNTRIYRVPGSVAVRKGPYRFIRHPNYVDVVCEIAMIPLVFHLYYTAMVFTVLNAIRRIKYGPTGNKNPRPFTTGDLTILQTN
jgi:methyltransferase